MAQITLNSSGVASNGSLLLQSNGTTTAVTIDTAQNMGLGVTPSAWASRTVLEVGAAGNAFVSGGAGDVYVTEGCYYNAGWKYGNSLYATALYNQYRGTHSWSTAAAGTAGNAITFTQAMTLDASGNLMVGTTTANGKLAVYQSTSGDGTISVGNAQDVYTCNVGKQGSSAYGATSAGDAFLYTSTKNISIMADGGSSVIKFSAGGNTERARITSGGYFKASDNGVYVNATASYHELRNTANSHTVYIKSTSASQAVASLLIDADRNTTNATFYAIEYYNSGAGATKFRVADSGNVTNTNNSYGQISDIKLKENIVDATSKLEKLNQVRVVNFNFIGNQQKQLGVVAQELEQIFPSMVEEITDRDKEGNDLGTTTKSVKYSVFVPMLIKALQEQQAIIQTLTDRITALEQA